MASRALSDYRIEMGEHGFSDLGNTPIDRAVNNAYEELVALERWPFLIREASGNLSIGSAALTAPTDLADVVSLTIDAQQETLTPMELDEFRKRFVGHYADTGLPALYYFIGGGASGLSPTMNVWPVPDAAYGYVLEYRAAPVTLSASGDIPAIPARYHRIISFRALSFLHAQEDNPQMAQFWEGQFMGAVAKMREEAWMQQSDRPNTILDVADDDSFYMP